MSLRRTSALVGLLLVGACATTSSPNSLSVQPSKTPPSVTLRGTKPVGALEYLAKAQAVAKETAEDVVLLRVDAQRSPDFNAHTPDGLATEWLFAFESPSAKKEINVSASSLEVRMIGDFPATLAPDTVLPATWVDSSKAFEVAQAQGGKDYLTTHPGKIVYYSLGMDPEKKIPVWTLRYSAQPRDGLLSFTVNASDGSFLEKIETQPSSNDTKAS